MLSNTTLEQLQLFEHVDYKVSVLLSDDNLLIEDNVHIFMTNGS